MPFSSEVFIEAARRADYKCGACGADLSGIVKGQESSRFQIHSSTTLHLVRLENDRSRCRVTSPPTSMENIKGKTLSVKMFRVFDDVERNDDAYCLCAACHSEIHTLALVLTKMSVLGHKGRNSSPTILEEMTTYYIMVKKQQRS